MSKSNGCVFCLFLFYCFFTCLPTTLFASTIQWDPSSTYIIPDDSNIYYLDSNKTLTADFTVRGSFEVWTGGTLTNNNNLKIGDSVAGGVMTCTGGIINHNNGNFHVSSDTYSGTLNIDGGTLNIGRHLHVSASSGIGTLNLSSGEIKFITGGMWLGIANGAGSTGYFNMSGGILNTKEDAGGLSLGDDSAGTRTGTGIMNLSGGTIKLHGAGNPRLYIGWHSVGVLNMSGGTIEQGSGTAAIGVEGDPSNRSSGVMNMYGGTYTHTGGNLIVVDNSNYSGNGTLNIYGNATMQIGGSSSNAYLYNNFGQASTSPGTSTINIYGDATVTMSTNGYIYNCYNNTNNTNMNIYGNGTFSMEDGTFDNGAYNIRWGILRVYETGTFNLYGGTFTNDSSTGGGTINIESNSFTMTNGVLNNNGDIYIGNSLDGGVLTCSGGTINHNAGNFYVSSGTYSGTLNIDGGTLNIAEHLWVGANTSSDGTLNLISGTINHLVSGKWLLIARGSGSKGYLNVSGGTLNIGAGLTLGDDLPTRTAIGTMNITGGTVNVNIDAASSLNIPYYSIGILNMSGGTFNHGSGTITVGYTGDVSNRSSGTMNLYGGNYTFTGGDLRLVAGENYSGNGTLNIYGNATMQIGGSSSDAVLINNYGQSATSPGVSTLDIYGNATVTLNTNGYINNCYNNTHNTYIKLLENATLTMNGGTFRNAWREKGRWGTLLLYDNATINHNSGSFLNGNNSTNSRIISYDNSTYNLSGGTFYNGNSQEGGWIFDSRVSIWGGNFNLNSGTFINANDSFSWGNFDITSGNLNWNGGTLQDGTGSTTGSSIFGGLVTNIANNQYRVTAGETISIPSGSGFTLGETYTLEVGTGEIFRLQNGSDFTYGGNLKDVGGGDVGDFDFWGSNITTSIGSKTLTVTNDTLFQIPTDSSLTLSSQNTLRLDSGSSFSFDGSLSGDGTFDFWGDGISPSGHTITITGNLDTDGNYFEIGPQNTFVIGNNGHLRPCAIAGTIFDMNGNLDWTGLITSNSKTYLWGTEFDGGEDTLTLQTNGATFAIDANKTLTLGTGTRSIGLTSKEGSFVFTGSLYGSGCISFANDTLHPTGNGNDIYSGSGLFKFESGESLSIPANHELTLSLGSTFSISSGCTLNVDGSFGYNGSILDYGNFNLWGYKRTIDDTTLTITSGTAFNMPIDESFTIGTGNKLTVENQATFSFAGELYNNGTINLWGYENTADFTGRTMSSATQQMFRITPNNTLRIGPSNTLAVSQNSTVLVNDLGTIINTGSNSTDIYGTTYISGTLENGDASNAGTVNIYFPGKLIVPGGSVENKHADSLINIKTGGKLYNYYGTIDNTLGYINLDAAGTFENVRGELKKTFTASAGSNFSDKNKIWLTSDLDIDFTWTITSQATIKGQGYQINLDSNGAIIIDPDASLKLEHLTINNVSGNNIRCIDDTSTLSIHNVTWAQESSYSFTKGKLYISGDWSLIGPSTYFSYESTQASTIAENSIVYVDHLFTFSYNGATQDLIEMTNKTSYIYCNHSTLHAQENWRLTKGSLILDNAVTLSSGAGKTLTFGNSSAGSTYDVDGDLYAGANVELHGAVIIDNVNA